MILTKIVFTVFHNSASDILRGSKEWWNLASKISRGSGLSNPRRIDAYDGKTSCMKLQKGLCLQQQLNIFLKVLFHVRFSDSVIRASRRHVMRITHSLSVLFILFIYLNLETKYNAKAIGTYRHHSAYKSDI